MADAIFEDQRLANIYDEVDADRSDLESYVALVDELGARKVLDIGCGTGTFACRLARLGLDVTAVDPAAASLEVARTKPHAGRVRWLKGDAATLPSMQVDVATMTGNVAQVFLTDEDWASTLRGVCAALRPGGVLLFEARDPDREGWREWNRAHSYRRLKIPGAGVVETWVDLAEVTPPFVSFRMTFVFANDQAVLTSQSTLRFRSRTEIAASLQAEGFVVDDVRDAPDRPGRELVFIARKTDTLPPSGQRPGIDLST